MPPAVVWLVAAMVWLAPPEKLVLAPSFPGWAETAQHRLERYEAIATAIHEVAYNPSEKPMFHGPRGRAAVAALLLAVSYKESAWAHDVDVGPCYMGKNPGKWPRCDGGQSACPMQIKIGSGTTKEGWSQADLFGDRRKCYAAGLRLIRQSYRACKNNHPDHRLNAYASGVCGLGYVKSRERIGLSRRILHERGPVPLDAESMPTARLPSSGSSPVHPSDKP